MIQEKTQKKVLKVIEMLQNGKSLSQALKAAKMTRGHFYSARDGMLRDGDPTVTKFLKPSKTNYPTPKTKPADVIPFRQHPDTDRLHAQAIRENDRLKWAEQLIEEIKGTQKRQTEILKKLMA